MAFTFQTLVDTLTQTGFYDFLLPLLLFFAIIFGLLEKIKIFKDVENATQLNVIISLVLSFFIIKFTPAGATLAEILTNLFGQGAIVLAGILVAILFVGILPMKNKELTGRYARGIATLLAIVAIIIFLGSGAGLIFGFAGAGLGGAGITFDFGWFTFDEPTIITLVMIIIIFGAIAWLVKSGGEKKKSNQTGTAS